MLKKINFENKTAKEVEFWKDDELKKILANKEILLSSGAIGSPQILQVSGIGESKKLKEFNINIINELKGVGKNLQDHLETYIQQECKTPDTLYSYVNKFNMVKVGIQWFLNKSGPLLYLFFRGWWI